MLLSSSSSKLVKYQWHFMLFAVALIGLAFSNLSLIHQQTTKNITCSSASSGTTTTTAGVNASKNVILWEHSPITYGHLHLAKTAGTTINGVLAAKFERVCGNKGYSYDAFQLNHGKIGIDDTISMAYGKKWNRGSVPPEAMDQIGYENCDYISIENPWTVWSKFIEKGNFELHVPCRNIFEYFMSQCNYNGIKFKCNATEQELNEKIEKCQVKPHRFDSSLVELVHNTSHLNNTMKCFDPVPVDHYIAKMGQLLQPKRVPATYEFRPTNKKRYKDKECIWQADNSHVADYVKEYLYKHYAIYQWCDDCMADPDRNFLFDEEKS